MSRSIVVLAAGLALSFASQAQAGPWVVAGTERGHHVALDIEGSTRSGSPFLATLAMVPRNWPANGYAYTLWIAEFDCAARSRTLRHRIAYSSRRDPVRTEFRAAADFDSNAAVATQLDILCGRTDRLGMQTFNHLGEFTAAFRR